MTMQRDRETNREDGRDKKDSGFVDHVVSLRRVTKVTKGGKRFSFAAFVGASLASGPCARTGRCFRLSGVHHDRHDPADPSPATSGSSRSDRLQASVAHCICRTARRDSCDNVEHRGATSTSYRPPARRWTAFGLTQRGHSLCRSCLLVQQMNCRRA